MSTTNELFEQLVSKEQELHKFEVRSNASKLSSLLTPGFNEFSSSGKVLSREDVLNRLPTVDDKSKIESSNFKLVHLSQDLAVITYFSKRIDSDGASLQFLRNSVWKNNNGEWQMEFHQGTIKN